MMMDSVHGGTAQTAAICFTNSKHLRQVTVAPDEIRWFFNARNLTD
jgi:hypothetical protein